MKTGLCEPEAPALPQSEDEVFVYPASFAQEQLWFLDQLEPGGAVYNIPLALELRGELAPAALAAALQEIERRHEMLRTTFAVAEGRPVQVIAAPGAAARPLPQVDLAALPGQARRQEGERLAAAEAARPFSLARGPLWRATLLRLAARDHLLLVTFHHVAADGWSLAVFGRELGALYTAAITGRPPDLAPLPLQYADFAVWQRGWLSGEQVASQLDHWRTRLAGIPPLAAVPLGRPRPPRRSRRGAWRSAVLPASDRDALYALARSRGASRFMVLLAVFATLLHRFTGEVDLVVGTPVAGRTEAETEPLIGLFVNLLPLRLDLAGDPPLAAQLARTRDACLQAFAWQELPFERLVVELQPERSTSHDPLVQVIFGLDQGLGVAGQELPGLRLLPVAAPAGGLKPVKFDLGLLMEETAGGSGGLLARLEISLDLLDPCDACRLLESVRVLVAGLAADPSLPLSGLPVLPAAARHQLLCEWNDTGGMPAGVLPDEGGPALHQLFERQVLRTPEAVAIRSAAGDALSYGELDRRANRLAHRLAALGVGPEVRVGIAMERAPGLVVGLLAILKAGGAYVPLDAGHPRERLAFILADAQQGIAAPLLLTQQALRARLPDFRGRVLYLDGEGGGLPPGGGDLPPAPRAHPENLAYVIYTSGSTGRPKGVAIAHRGAVALLRWAGELFSAAELAGTLASTSITFDLSVFELFLPLSRGGAVVLAGDALALPGLPAGAAVTLINTVPSAMAELLRLGGLPPAAATVNLAGEPLKRSLAEQVFAELPGVTRLYNLYGPSEDTTYSTFVRVAAGAGHEPTIGRPIAGTRAHVLDRRLQPLPIGVPGELCLGGVGLARGYLARPELTARSFVPDPFGGRGERLYRTGDLVRRLPDGELDFLGRIDHQVKLRGFRIELGEIEAALTAHPGVREAVVLAREDSPGRQRLVAYVTVAGSAATGGGPVAGAGLAAGAVAGVAVGAGAGPPGAAELAELLRRRLPDYMVPEAFVRLDALPLTANGKVDRRALPAPEWRRGAEAPKFAPPRGPIEELVAGIWSEVLGIEPIGIHDRFFDLGGHSLLATQVVSRVRRACAVEVPLRALFEAPTLAGFAARVEAARAAGESGTVPPIGRASREQPLPASFAQERLWFLDRLGAGGPAYNLAYALRLGGTLAVPVLAAALAELVRRHESLRTTFTAAGSGVAQVVAPARRLPLPVVALDGLPPLAREAERRRLGAAAARQPFDLERGPLLRTVLLRLAPPAGGEHVLLLTMHHIVSDGWSQGVLLRELAALYAAAANGGPGGLPEPPIQYADFASWQRDWLRGEALERQVAFWRRQLAGAPELLELPLDRPRPAVQSLRGARRAAALPPALASDLRLLGRRQGTTLFMSLLAAYAALLGRHAGCREVLIGTPIAGRNRVETEGLIGCFVNTLVLRVDLSGDPTGGELLGRVREVTLAAYAHQDLPFEKLVEELRPRRNLSHTPLFQALMILQNTPPAPASAAGLALAGEDLDQGTAKFDLNLGLAEVGSGTGDGRLVAALEYCRDLFLAPTAERLLGHFGVLASGLAAGAERRLSELPLLAAGERQQLVVEWNDSSAPWPEGLCLHEPFAAQAARQPDATALRFGGESWSYGELDRFSNRLARQLCRAGVGEGSLVGVLLERRPEMVGAVLAVLKAGGAYVPLEVSWPPDRLHWILSRNGIACLVTEAARLAQLAELPALPELVHVVTVDEPGETSPADGPRLPGPARLWSAAGASALPSSPLPRRAGPDDLAYVIFTSGSTGRPKGVMVRHRPVLNLVEWVNTTFAVGPGDCLLFVTALSFDLSVYDLFGILAAGGCVRIARRDEARDPEALVRILRREPVTFWDSAPAALQQLVPLLAAKAGPADAVTPALRLVFLSGDWIPLTLPATVREAFPRARVISLGGATEATIWSNWFPVGEVDSAWASIPYGRPIQNARYHVLDAHGNPCPIGVQGDLYIAGECLSQGYLNAPELTASSYLPDVLGGGPGDRLYATGDRARYGAAGDLEFLGRLDAQVKLRGFRIELGEIEAVLVSHDGVREAVVLVREDVPGDRRLVAYLIPDGEAPAASELRRFARRKLPDYMVPAAFVTLASWPVSPNGKLDRKALPPPAAAPSPPAGEALVPPRTALERAIAAAWREVIGLGEVGVRDNFFEVGGHSLLMARVQARLEETLGRSVPLVELFQHPTIAALAAHLGGAPREEVAAATAPAEAVPAEALAPGSTGRAAPAFPGPAQALTQGSTGAALPAFPGPEVGVLDGLAARRAPAAATVAFAPARAPAGSAPVAVIGLAGRFPGAPDVESFWRNLRDGVESIRFFTDEELLAAGFPAELLGDPRLVKARGALAGAELFDAEFFGYAPREAQIIDPQHRLFLECAWEALEDAGYDPARFGGRVGVFGGATENTYMLRLLTDPELIRAVGRQQISIANNADFLCTRVSYKLNLTGPSAAVQTACSTSLVAVHLACGALLRGDCDLALAGGVSVQAREVSGYLYQEGGISSPDGHTRAFDAAARGVVSGSGAGVVVLRRLDAALAAGDSVRAVVLGSAVNNDGNLKVGFTAPSAAGQAAVIREALATAGVDAATIGYVEAHGTGTPLGDPIEIAGLTQAFGPVGTARCALGSVKTNIGHLDAAAGVAGLIKAVLALERRQIPASLHFTRPNPSIDFAGSPFYVNSRLAEWVADGVPRRASVSSFGIGGTNAHLVLEEAPPAAPAASSEPPAPSRPLQLLVLSARSAAALDQASLRLAEALERRPDLDLANVAYTLQVGRRALRHRRMVVCRDHGEAVASLRRAVGEASGTSPGAGEPRPVVFLFPGQGTQYPGMAAGLYAHEPDFRAAMDECCDLLAPELGCDLRELLAPRRRSGRGGGRVAAAARLEQTELAQPALFTVEYALARLLMGWGIQPQAMLGHSVGELVAACLAGVFPLADALRLVAARGRWMQQLPAGAMLAVELAEEAVLPLLAEGAEALDLAAVNGPRSCVVSGPPAAVTALRRWLETRGVSCRLLHTSHAFHSRAMDALVEPFAELVGAATRRPPRIAWLSNVTGGWITPAEAVAPAYWARHLRQTVRFADSLAELGRGGGAGEERDEQEPILLEVGPGRTLTTLARQQSGAGGRRIAIATLPAARDRRGARGEAGAAGDGVDPARGCGAEAGAAGDCVDPVHGCGDECRGGEGDVAAVLAALGRLWLAGAEVAWEAFHGRSRRRRVPLPTYPFERRRFWVDARAAPAVAAPVAPVQVAPAPAAPGPAAPAQAVPRPAAAALAAPALAAPASSGAAAADAAPAPADFVAPRNEVEQGIAEIWCDLLGVERVGSEDDFFALGGSSLMAVQFGDGLRQRFGVEGATLLLEAGTLAELAAMVTARTRPAADPAAAADLAAAEAAAGPPAGCLVRLQGGGAKRPLFLVHQVGGHVFSFRALARALGRELPVYGLRSRGLEEGEEPLPTVEAMAELYLASIRGVQPHGPYRIGGASMGGMVAWEMAQRLRDAGEAVELLALMDTPCGEQMPARPQHDWELVGGVMAGRVPLTPAELAPLSLDDQLRYALDKAGRAGAGGGLTLAAARRLVEVLRANVDALFRYAPRAWPGRLLFFRARERRAIDPPRPELPWIELAEAGTEVVLVAGNHETMHEPPHVLRTAERLRSCL
jgi:amino acid adenylation domain-containing protein